jgi:hypothetical protein
VLFRINLFLNKTLLGIVLICLLDVPMGLKQIKKMGFDQSCIETGMIYGEVIVFEEIEDTLKMRSCLAGCRQVEQ